jgi:hypothetical protein
VPRARLFRLDAFLSRRPLVLLFVSIELTLSFSRDASRETLRRTTYVNAATVVGVKTRPLRSAPNGYTKAAITPVEIVRAGPLRSA